MKNSPPLEGWRKFEEFLTGWFKSGIKHQDFTIPDS